MCETFGNDLLTSQRDFRIKQLEVWGFDYYWIIINNGTRQRSTCIRSIWQLKKDHVRHPNVYSSQLSLRLRLRDYNCFSRDGIRCFIRRRYVLLDRGVAINLTSSSFLHSTARVYESYTWYQDHTETWTQYRLFLHAVPKWVRTFLCAWLRKELGSIRKMARLRVCIKSFWAKKCKTIQNWKKQRRRIQSKKSVWSWEKSRLSDLFKQNTRAAIGHRWQLNLHVLSLAWSYYFSLITGWFFKARVHARN